MIQLNPLNISKKLPVSRWLFFLNIVIYLWIAASGDNFPFPTTESLIRFGAKEPVLLAEGEWWRLFAPILIHSDIMHLMFNSWALWVFGPFMENHLGARKFILVYVFSGVCGVVASSLFNVSISVGASGAIFGLMGAGFFIERIIKDLKKQQGIKTTPQDNIFFSLILANLIIGFSVSKIDNAAHLGGLISGFLLVSTFYFRSHQKRWLANMILGAIGVSVLLSVYLITDQNYVSSKLVAKADDVKDPHVSFFYLSKALVLTSEDNLLRFRRMKKAVYLGSWKDVISDVEILLSTKEFSNFHKDFLKELQEQNRIREEKIYLEIIEKASSKRI